MSESSPRLADRYNLKSRALAHPGRRHFLRLLESMVAGLREPVSVERLEPFVEPSLCRVRLARCAGVE